MANINYDSNLSDEIVVEWHNFAVANGGVRTPEAEGPHSKIVTLARTVLDERDRILRLEAGIRDVIEGRAAGDFSPLLPKLKRLIGESDD